MPATMIFNRSLPVMDLEAVLHFAEGRFGMSRAEACNALLATGSPEDEEKYGKAHACFSKDVLRVTSDQFDPELGDEAIALRWHPEAQRIIRELMMLTGRKEILLLLGNDQDLGPTCGSRYLPPMFDFGGRLPLSAEDLRALRERHTPVLPGPCPVCGGRRSPVSADKDGIGYSCDMVDTSVPGWEDHYSKSKFFRLSTDPRILKLLDEHQAMSNKLACLSPV